MCDDPTGRHRAQAYALRADIFRKLSKADPNESEILPLLEAALAAAEAPPREDRCPTCGHWPMFAPTECPTCGVGAIRARGKGAAREGAGMSNNQSRALAFAERGRLEAAEAPSAEERDEDEDTVEELRREIAQLRAPTIRLSNGAMIDRGVIRAALASGFSIGNDVCGELLMQLEAAEARTAQLEQERESGEWAIHTVQMPDGSPCAAPCAIEGCQYARVEAAEARVAEGRKGVELLQRRLTLANEMREAAEADNARLRAALEQVEWVEPDWATESRMCAWCRERESDGHAADCPRQAALKAQP